LFTGVRTQQLPDASRWILFAEADLRAAQLLSLDSDVPGRIACFHAQQAAEKALKAVLVANNVPFRKTHDLVVLVGLLPSDLREVLEVLDTDVLQPWAVDGRYPGDLPDASADEAAEAVAIANAIVTIARSVASSEDAEENNE
jgi:HEPN domain-containing protein